MNAIELKLRDTLVELDRRVKSISPHAPKPDLLPVFAELDTLAGQLPPETSPRLRHYLQQKSYEKARLFLEGRESENATGNCTAR